MFIKKCILFLIKFYQALPLRSHYACCFYPTCSEYAYAVINKHGTLKGAWLSIKRIGKCHPFN